MNVPIDMMHGIATTIWTGNAEYQGQNPRAPICIASSGPKPGSSSGTYGAVFRVPTRSTKPGTSHDKLQGILQKHLLIS